MNIGSYFNENPRHMRYISEFRTKHCTLFSDHKCPFHKPFNCFDWHFPNQRRRVPVIKEDGTFNYNPDLYCNIYDPNTGICTRDNECQYVHMNAGDTERRYHPRYYKTGMCIYETTVEGICGKNGIHCAFAHDQSDLRRPVLDIRETTNHSNLSALLEKERVLSEDPAWNDMEYVLAFYKLQECKKPPKTCRQGYACPFYHSAKDRRRPLDAFIYQSQPCVYIKPNNEDWLDVTFCPLQDNCKFSHSRTEQQFHPDIFKSSKCNDMIRDNCCPRGPFCAFAHNDDEMNSGQYLPILKNVFSKFPQSSINQFPSTQCLAVDAVGSQTTNDVFQKSKLSLADFTESDLISNQDGFLKLNGDQRASTIFSALNIKQILERALSSSSNVEKISEKEIQDLISKFSSENSYVLEPDKQIENSWSESGGVRPGGSQSSIETMELEDRSISKKPNSLPLPADVSDSNRSSKFSNQSLLEKTEEELKQTQRKLKLVLNRLENFLNWMERLEISDTFKEEIKLQISLIIDNVGFTYSPNDSLSE